MFLTEPQKRILDILRGMGVLRMDQADYLLHNDYPDLKLSQIYGKLVQLGKINSAGNLLFLPGHSYDLQMIDVVDIMMEVAKDHIIWYQHGINPFLLTFFHEKDGKLWRYDICPVKYGTERIVNAALEGIETGFRTILFLLEKKEQQKGLVVECAHAFVLKTDGKFHYYKEEAE